MSKTIRKMITLFAAVLVMTAMLTACSQQTEEASEDTADSLSVVYEGYSTAEETLMLESGELVDTRSCYFVIENTTDKELQSAKYRIIGLDENGEELQRSDGENSKSMFIFLPYLKPGERALGEITDADWEETPASYKVEIFETVWGSSKGVPITVVDATAGDGAYVRNVTIRNDGEEDYSWIFSFEDGVVEETRQAELMLIYKEDDGNVTCIDRATFLDGDDFLQENFTIAPGEEKTLEVSVNDPDREPEFCICWR